MRAGEREGPRALGALDAYRQALANYGQARSSSHASAELAHDLNNVLGALVLRAALLQADPACMAAQGSNINAMARLLKDAAERVRRMEERLLSRQKGGERTLDLAAILGEAVQVARASFAESSQGAAPSVELDISLPSPFSVGFSEGSGASPGAVCGALVEILVNAREAMPSGGTIEIRGKRRMDAAILTIADGGHGVSDAELRSIFDPLFTTKGEGHDGLGLSNAYDVMFALGGKISAANREGGGAIFTLTFPDVGERGGSTSRADAPEPPRPRVLVIDKNAAHQVLTKAIIELEGRQVDTASSAREAAAKARGGAAYDLILCDLEDDALCDPEVARVLCSSTPGSRVYLTSLGSEGLVEGDPRRAFVSGVLLKPIRRDVVSSLLSPH